MRTVQSRGFTLIEMMIVVALVVILGAIAYPSYQGYVTRTRRAEGKSALMQAMMQQERFYAQNTTYVAFNAATPNGFRTFSGDNLADSAYTLSGAVCAGDRLANCIEISAQPRGTFVDAQCGTLRLTSAGLRTATGPATNCWN